MADEFQAGICSGSWWNTARNSLGTSPCSAAVLSDMGSFGWSTDMMMDMKARSSTSDDDESASVCDNSTGFQDIILKPHPVDSGGVLIDSTLQMLGFGLSSSSATSDWNSQTLLHGSERSEGNYYSMLQEDMTSSRLNYRQEERSSVDCHQFQTDWSWKNYGSAIGDEDSTVVTCQGLPTSSFPMGSANNTYNNYPSSILQSLFEPDHDEPQPQQSVFDNYHSSANFRPKLSPNFLKPSLPKQQPANHLQFSNNVAPFWNGTSAAAANNEIRTTFLSSHHSKYINPTFEDKPNCVNLTAKLNSDIHGSMAKNNSNEPAFKRPRIETPSPLPTFKVRKEKLGDRITALQQLVSPFGKTDTASVLNEAIEYIKFLHDQVSVLSTPYMKNGAHNVQHQQISNKLKDSEGTKQDLRSRGLCLVPIPSTYPVANETTSDFWTPTYGGTFR